MGTAAKPTRENRTITVDFQNETTYFQLLGDGKAFVECVLAFHPVPWLSAQAQGDLSRRRVPDASLALCPCPPGWAHHLAHPVYEVQSGVHRPAALRLALSPDATGSGPRCPVGHPWGLSLERCAVICHISPMALYRLVCAFGHQSLVTVLTRCGLPLPTYFLADEKHSRCLTEKVYLPTIVSGRVIWHLGYTEDASAAALTQSYGVFQRAAFQQEPSYRVRGILTDGFDSTTKSMRTLFPGTRLGTCLRHAVIKLPEKLAAIASPVRQALRSRFHTLCTGPDSAKACAYLRWASGCATLPITSRTRLGRPMASACGAGFRRRKRAGMRCSKIRRCR